MEIPSCACGLPRLIIRTGAALSGVIPAAAFLLAAVVMFNGCGIIGRCSVCEGDIPSKKPCLNQAYDDPFSYCGCAQTVDIPGEGYKGEKIPDAMIDPVRKKVGLAADVPADYIRETTSWRCMDGKVFVCVTGANLPCLEKADDSKTPSGAMNEYCMENPGADYIPAVVAGRSTIFDWRCSGMKPVIDKQVRTTDRQGYFSDIWFELGKD